MTAEEKEDLLIVLIDKLCDKKYSIEPSNQVQSLENLKRIYSADFRHSYSKIFYKLQEIFSEDFEISSALGENLNCLNIYLKDQLSAYPEDANLQNVKKGFQKFSDHINLEIGRYNFVKQLITHSDEKYRSNNPIKGIDNSQLEPIKSKLSEHERAIESIKPVVTQAQKAVDQVDSKLESNKISSITALTIFSAVILSFSGGISFEASVFNNIAEASPYRLIFVISLSGFILFNTIFALLYIVSKMSGKSISTRCKYLSTQTAPPDLSRSCGSGHCTKQCSSVSLACKVWHKYAYVFAINLILLCFIYADYILWTFRPKTSILAFNFRELLLLFAPLVFGGIILLIVQVNKVIQSKRIFLAIKCDFVSKYLNPIKVPEIFNSLTLFANILGRQPQNFDKEFSELIKNTDVKSDKSFEKLINSFVEERLMTAAVLANTISLNQHKKNKKRWKKLFTQLNRYDAVAVQKSASSTEKVADSEVCH